LFLSSRFFRFLFLLSFSDLLEQICFLSSEVVQLLKTLTRVISLRKKHLWKNVEKMF
jgi:hypothetical protein